MKKQIGKNTLGGGQKMEVDLRTYNRSTHDLSYAWRSSMGVGTLVPFCKKLALSGDHWSIDLNTKVLTYPTTGPLFGSFKLQLDMFMCPIRLYNAMLHNNTLGVGLNMDAVKLPIYGFQEQAADGYFSHISTSSALNYLGHKGTNSKDVEVTYNGVPLLAYWDIFKNYYANKQESKFYYIGMDEASAGFVTNLNMNTSANTGNTFVINWISFHVTDKKYLEQTKLTISDGRLILWPSDIQRMAKVTPTPDKDFVVTMDWIGDERPVISANNIIAESVTQTLVANDLSLLDTFREKLLAGGRAQIRLESLDSKFVREYKGACQFPQGGLLLKTYQSDMFVNYINSTWIDGDNGIGGITKLTSVDTSSGSFSIDTLNLAQKVYDMLNRIAVSGGTYYDWLETVYTHDIKFLTETPVYIGGASAEIEFSPVVSTASSGDDPLGTLAGRGQINEVKNGHIEVTVDEPSYLVGIASITPRVDYSQGNDWDLYLKSLNDLHKPALDGIGYQDLMAVTMDWRANGTEAVGKQPAWLQYMTSVNETHGTLAAGQADEYMVLNRHYNDDYSNTYINPVEYTYMFAENTLSTTPFWVQIGLNMIARRVMSAKQIPLM